MPTAILSVSDKTGLEDFAQALTAMGWRLLASGGTAAALRQANLPVTEVAEYTGSPEILGGRVKTLHPGVHGGLLARPGLADRQELQSLGWELIDLAVVNLYPFPTIAASPTATEEEIIESIDVGGVAIIRAAAKNYDRVTLVCDPEDYAEVLAALQADRVDEALRVRLARKGFLVTSRYDAAIAAYFSRGYLGDESLPPGQPWALSLYPAMDMRYGENPHQSATLYTYRPGDGPLGGRLLHGKPLSYNNLLDLDSAWRTVQAFAEPTVAIVKHLSPIGVAAAASVEQALALARACDPLAAFGGVVAANRPFDAMSAGALSDLFVECVAAPWYEPTALDVLRRRSHLRILDMSGVETYPNFELRSVNAGVLRQNLDRGDPQGTHWRVVSHRPPTQLEWDQLRFAWQAVQMVKSNALVLARAFPEGIATVGIGSGQPSRVSGVRQAAEMAGGRARGAVLASDAFFPFPDSIEAAAEAGVTAIIAPGGSVRDEEAVEVADLHEMAMVFTGVRHFRH